MTAATTYRQKADGGFLLSFHRVSSGPGSVSREDAHRGEHSQLPDAGPAGREGAGRGRARVGAHPPGVVAALGQARAPGSPTPRGQPWSLISWHCTTS